MLNLSIKCLEKHSKWYDLTLYSNVVAAVSVFFIPSSGKICVGALCRKKVFLMTIKVGDLKFKQVKIRKNKGKDCEKSCAGNW